MKRYKRVAVLLAVLALACAATFAVSRYEQHKEQIAESGETVLAIDPDAVTALSWTVGDESLAFHKDESWLYDADEAFPAEVDGAGVCLVSRAGTMTLVEAVQAIVLGQSTDEA